MNHTITTFIMGLYIIDNTIIKNKIENSSDIFNGYNRLDDIYTTWAMISIVHDYCYFKPSQRNKNIRKHLSTILNDVPIPGTYNVDILENYYYMIENYPKMEQYDHGIHGGIHAYYSLKKTRENNIKKLSTETDQLNQLAFPIDDLNNNIVYKENDEMRFKIAARSICEHNIFKCQDNDKEKYLEFHLQELLNNDFKIKIENIFTYLLGLVDTIEFIKKICILKNDDQLVIEKGLYSPANISKLVIIEAKQDRIKLKISPVLYSSLYESKKNDLENYLTNIKKLDKWMDVVVNEKISEITIKLLNSDGNSSGNTGKTMLNGFSNCMNKFVSINMNWGDCHIIQSFQKDHMNNYTLPSSSFTIDYGSHSINRTNQTMQDYKKNIFENSNALLTHYHEDHFNGFLNAMQNYGIKYKTFYLPKIAPLPMSQLNYRAQLFMLSLLLQPSMLYFQATVRQINFINSVFSNSQSVVFVQKGSQIIIDNNNYNVLWPDLEIEKKDLTSYDKFINSLVEYLPQETIGIIIEELSQGYLLKDFYNLLQGERISELTQNIDRFNNKILKSFYDNDDIEKPRKTKFVKFLLRKYWRIAKKMNDYCVVFHEKEKLLMLADVSREKYNNFISTEKSSNLELSSFYTIIKASHHGTQDYYSNKILNSENTIITNYPIRNYGIISNSYYTDHINKKNNKIFCMNSSSNANCMAYHNPTMKSNCGSCYNNIIQIYY